MTVLLLKPKTPQPKPRNRSWLTKRISEAGPGRHDKAWWLAFIERLQW